MNPINTENNASYNFKAPSIPEDGDKKTEMVFPTAEVVSPTISSEEACVPVRRQTTIVELGGISRSIDMILLPQPADLNVGAVVVVNWESDADCVIHVIVDDEKVADLPGKVSTKTTKQLIWDGKDFLALT